jgi:gluconolactonase
VQRLSPLDHAVLPAKFFRNPFSDSLISTTDQDTEKPIFQHLAGPFVSSHNSFNRLVKPGASIKVLAKRDYAFAHEAGVYSKQRNEVWFTSNLLPRNGTQTVEISRISLDTGDVSAVKVEGVDRGNGACSYNGGILFCEQGSCDTPSQLVWCDPNEPSTSRVILNNFNGRPFNSLNDVIILENPAGDLIFFTDPPYGFEQHFRPRPQLPPAVYAFDPREGHVRMVLDGLAHPNGIAFSPDGTVCYVTDTSHIRGCGRLDPSLQSTM